VGGKENTFHCDICDCCFNIAMKDNHQCVQKRFKQDCPICMEDMQNSIKGATLTRCGHSMHAKCLQQYSRTNIACPICKKSLIDPLIIEAHMD